MCRPCRGRAGIEDARSRALPVRVESRQTVDTSLQGATAPSLSGHIRVEPVVHARWTHTDILEHRAVPCPILEVEGSIATLLRECRWAGHDDRNVAEICSTASIRAKGHTYPYRLWPKLLEPLHFKLAWPPQQSAKSASASDILSTLRFIHAELSYLAAAICSHVMSAQFTLVPSNLDSK